MGIQQVRLYQNTVSTPPTTFTDVTSQFSGRNPNTVNDEVASATVTMSNLVPGVTTFAWIEALDEAGNSSGIQPCGSMQTKERFYAGFGANNTGIFAASRTAAATNTRATNLLDVNPATVFQSGTGYPQWVQYQLPAPRKLTRYRLRARNDNQFRPGGWRILGSNDGTTFATVHDVLLPADTFIPQVISTTGEITVVDEENVLTEGEVWVEPQDVSISSVIDNSDDEFYIGWVYSDVPYLYYRLEITNQPVSGTTSSTVRLSLSHWALSDEEPAQLTNGLIDGIRWLPNTPYTSLANTKSFSARFILEGVTPASSGIIAEFGGGGVGYALYIHDGKLVQDYGSGAAVNQLGVLLSIDLQAIQIKPRFIVEVRVSSSGGTTIAIDGVVLASHAISIGATNVGGGEEGGIGQTYGTGVRANLAGWVMNGGAGQGVFTGGKIVQALFYPNDRTIIGRGTVVPGAIFSQSSLVNADYGCEKAFNGTMFPTHTNGAGYTHWLQVELPAPRVVTRYRVWAAPLTSFIDAPIDWTLQGSNDGTNWNIVDTRVESMPPISAGAGINYDTLVSLAIPHGDFLVQTQGSYRFYRLHVTKTGGGNPTRDTILKVSEIELAGL